VGAILGRARGNPAHDVNVMRPLFLAFRSLFLRARLEREMRDEMQQHIDDATARNIARGMSPRDASHAAHREFGNVDYIRELGWDARGSRWIDSLTGDARFAFRHFRRTPLPTLTMVLVLALGIGANVVLFTVFHSLWTLPGPGIEHDDALVRIRGTEMAPREAGWYGRPMSYVEVAAYRAQQGTFADVAALATGTGRLSTVNAQAGPVTTGLNYITDNYFRLLRVRPMMGSALPATPLTAGDASALSAVIAYATWQDLFDGEPDVIGRTLRVNDMPVTVVGVMPNEFRGTGQYAYMNQLWLPLAAYPLLEKSNAHAFASPDSALFGVVARLQPGVRRSEAMRVVKTIADRALSARTHAPDGAIGSADVVPLLSSNGSPRNDNEMKLAAAGFSALTLLVLLVTCTNVSSLLVGMAVARRREIAVRLSLGANRRRLIGQLLVESVILALMASIVALFAIWFGMRVIDARIPGALLSETLVYDWQATLFACGIALVTGVVFGLSPALHATRLAVADVLKDAGAALSSSRSLMHRALVVLQITLTQPLLVGVGAILLVVTDDIRRHRDSPIDHQLLVMSFDAFVAGEGIQDRAGDLERIRERLAAVPGVMGVTRQSSVTGSFVVVHPADRAHHNTADDTIPVRARSTMPGYLALNDVPLVRGRDFTIADVDSVPRTIIIEEGLARDLFGAEDPLGKRVLIRRDSTLKTIVGIVDADRAQLLQVGNDDPQVFLPPTRSGIRSDGRVIAFIPTLLVRTRGPAAEMIPELRAVARATVPQLPLSRAITIEQQNADSRRERLEIASALSAGGFVALFLSAIGLYAVVAFAVNQRTREIGIRTALGARPLRVAGSFFLSGIRLSALGVLIGLPLSLIGLRFFASIVDLPPTSPAAVALIVCAGVLLIASIATWLPARRAAAVDPLTALRSE
jgi:putative ABC transport system permease protein